MRPRWRTRPGAGGNKGSKKRSSAGNCHISRIAIYPAATGGRGSRRSDGPCGLRQQSHRWPAVEREHTRPIVAVSAHDEARAKSGGNHGTDVMQGHYIGRMSRVQRDHPTTAGGIAREEQRSGVILFPRASHIGPAIKKRERRRSHQIGGGP